MNCSFSGKERIAALRELDNSKIVEVSPDGLPVEIKDLLITSGNWDIVKNNLRCIQFTPQVNTGNGINSMEASGQAFPAIKRVEIGYLTPEGEKVPVWEIAVTLIHEAAHVEWRKEKDVLQNSTPNERHAFATELAFLLRTPKPTDFEEARILDEAIARAKSAVRTANIIMGYEIDDMDPNNRQIPNEDFCQNLSLENCSDLNLHYYPAKPAPDFLTNKSDFMAFVYRLAGKIDIEIADLLWDVLDGTATIEINFNVQETVDSAKVKYLDGQEIELDEEIIERLKDVYLSLIPAEWKANAAPDFNPLLAHGNAVWPNGGITIFIQDSTSLRMFLYSLNITN